MFFNLFCIFVLTKLFIMAKVQFRCDGKNENMFILFSVKDINYIPLVGDIIKTSNKEFIKASFRIKPWRLEKTPIADNVVLDFKVVSREYSLYSDEWVLTCEPISESLIFLLKNIKPNK